MSYLEDLLRRIAEREFNLRIGQERTARHIAANPGNQICRVVLPTGYGKSIVSLLAFDLWRALSGIKRMLIVVPTDVQRKQYIKKLTKKADELGIEISGVQKVDSSARMLRHHLKGIKDVFVATTAMLTTGRDSGGIADLLESGGWLCVLDEWHKIAEENDAGKVIKTLPFDRVLAMTATPTRTRGERLLFDGPIDVEVSIEEAYDERAIRGVVAHIEHYFLWTHDDSGTPQKIRTQELRGEGDLSNYLKSRGLRLLSKYYSTMLIAGIECLRAKLRAHPRQHQMLVFCMNVSHARDVSEVMNMLQGEEGFADWIGVGPDGRSDAENADVLDRYDENELPCLVQVEKAGEGFDNQRASVLVFLNILGKNTVRARQQPGRGLRRNPDIPFKDDLCDIFASPDTDFADLAVEYALRTVGDIYAHPGDGSGDSGDSPKDDYWLPPELPPFSSLVQDAEFEKSEIFSKVDDEEVKQVKLHHKQDFGTEPTSESIRYEILKLRREEFDRRKEELERKRPEELRAMIDGAAGTLAATAVRILSNGEFDKSLLGLLKKRIHSQWKFIGMPGHDAMLDDELEKKYEWIRSIQAMMRDRKEVPQWLK